MTVGAGVGASVGAGVETCVGVGSGANVGADAADVETWSAGGIPQTVFSVLVHGFNVLLASPAHRLHSLHVPFGGVIKAGGIAKSDCKVKCSSKYSNPSKQQLLTVCPNKGRNDVFNPTASKGLPF